MNPDLNRAVMYSEDALTRIRKITLLFRQIEQCASVIQDQLNAIDHDAKRMGVK